MARGRPHQSGVTTKAAQTAARLESGVQRLLSHVPIALRLVIAMALLLLPLIAVDIGYMRDKTAAIQGAELERSGLVSIEPLHHFMRDAAAHRSLSYRYLLGDHSLLPQIQASELQAGRDLAQLQAQEEAPNASLMTFAEFMAIKSAWRALTNAGLNMPAGTCFARHTALLAEALDLNDSIAANAGMLLDPRAKTYFLMDALVVQDPRLREQIGQLQGALSGLPPQGDLTPAETSGIAAQTAVIRERVSGISYTLTRAYDYSPSLQTQLGPRASAADAMLTPFLDAADQLSRNGTAQFSAAQLAANGAAALDEYDGFDDVLDTSFKNALGSATAALEGEEQTAALLTTGIAMLAIFFVLIIVRSVTAPLKKMTQVIDRLAEGDDQARAHLDLADEIGVLGRQFDKMIGELKAAETTLRRENEKNLALLRNASDGIHILDAGGNIIEASDSFCAMLGYRRDEMIGMNVSRWDAGFSPAELFRLIAEDFTRNGRNEFDTIHRRKDGVTFDVEVSTLPLVLDGTPVLFCSSRDITKRKKAEAALRESELRFRTVIEQSPIAMGFSRDGCMLDVNPAYLKLYGYDNVEEVRGQHVNAHIAPEYRAEMAERISRRIRGEPTETTYEAIALRKDGSRFPVFASAQRVILGDGPLTVGFLIDFTERKAAEEKINHLAFYDHLTGLPNRRLLSDRLQQALAATMHSERTGALLLVDLDNFKTLNDTVGHDIGDILLQQIAARLSSCLREGDTVARFGADEFVVLLANLGEMSLLEAAAQTETIAGTIFTALRRPYHLGRHEFRGTSSIGATLFGGQHASTEELLKQADIAMYQAKKSGGDHLRFFDPQMQQAIAARAALEHDMRGALEAGQFHLFYQIQVDSTGRTLGAETLIRWLHPARGLVCPGQFIPLAEETGLILPIGQWVLDTACAQLKAWQSKPATSGLVLAVNVSLKQLHQPGFVQEVKSSLSRHGADPRLLKLEITESMLQDDVEATIATMKALQDIGVKFSLDDFGTGYSSLQYLKRLPLDQLKIDQSFVRDLAIDSSDRAIVSTVIAMAGSLRLDVIAEGVETQEQRQILLGSGCEHFQGYLFGKPVPIEQFEALLEAEPHAR